MKIYIALHSLLCKDAGGRRVQKMIEETEDRKRKTIKNIQGRKPIRNCQRTIHQDEMVDFRPGHESRESGGGSYGLE